MFKLRNFLKRKALLNNLYYPVLIFALWRGGIFIFQLFFQPFYKITIDSADLYHRLFYSWGNVWDGGHYISIAANGYQFPQQAFFPLWPMLIRLFTVPHISVYVAAYVLSFILSLTTFILFYLLACKITDRFSAKLSLLIFASFPSTMFLHSGYSETLFASLVLGSFLLTENKHYFLGVLCGSLVTATRATGVALSVSYLFLKKSLSKRILFMVIVLSGLFSYMLYLYLSFGDPLLFKTTEEAWCPNQHCQWTSPFNPLSTYSNLVSIGWVKPNLSASFIDWFSSVVFLLMLIPVYLKLGPKYCLYALIIIISRLSTGWTVGMIRYVLMAFPVFFVLPLLIKSKIVWIIIALGLFLLQLRFVALFTSRLWVA